MIKGKLIVFSGIDCSGKTTQAGLLLKYLNESKKRAIYLWNRGGYTPFLNFLKSIPQKVFLKKNTAPVIYQDKRKKIFENTFLRNLWINLAIVDLILIFGVYIRLLKVLDIFVVVDRYIWDTNIDFKLNFPEADIDRLFLWKLLCFLSPKPNHIFLLKIPVDESLRRSQEKKEPFPQREDMLYRRFGFYKELMQLENLYIFDGAREKKSIENDIRSIIRL